MASEIKRKPFNDACIIALYRIHRLVGWFLLSRLDRVLLGKWTIDCPEKSASFARNFRIFVSNFLTYWEIFYDRKKEGHLSWDYPCKEWIGTFNLWGSEFGYI
jgi:hypothetical protein